MSQKFIHIVDRTMTNDFRQPSPYQTIGCDPLMLLCDIGHIGKDHREGDGKDAGHGDDGEVPPERRKHLGL